MQFKALTVLALSALAIASPELKKRQENPTQASVYSVLLTALPPSLLAIGATNTAAVGSIIESSFAAGETPAWFTALPSDVQSYLLSSGETATAGISSAQASISAVISPSLNTTTISSVHSASLKATTTAAGSVAASASSAQASSTGGASYPSAVVGAGVAGALGLLGMLAL